MKFYNDFIGEDINNTKVNFLHGNSDSEENYTSNLKTQPEDWYYRENKVEYSFNSSGHRSKEIKDLDFDNYLLFIGCSHTQGVGVTLENTYSHMISKKFKCDYYNLGISATGIDVLEYNLLTWFFKFNKKPKAVIAQFPDHSRFLSCYEGYSNLIPNGSWNIGSDKNVEKLLVNGEDTGFFYARKNISYRLINTVVQVPTVRINYGSQVAYDTIDEVRFRRLDLARDLSHPGVESHKVVADTVSTILNTQVK
jgi:hypothetical protein